MSIAREVVRVPATTISTLHCHSISRACFFRHMNELIKRGNVFIAQPPLYGIKKGKATQ